MAQIMISISSKNLRTIFSKFDVGIFFLYQNIKEFFFILITDILIPF